MYETQAIPQLRARGIVMPEPLSRQSSLTLTELAGCIIIATACVDMWLGINTLIRSAIYILAVALAFIGSGFKPRLTPLGGLFFLGGGLYIVKAVLYPPVPSLVRSDIRNILVGFAFLVTLGIPALSSDGWKRFQLRVHRTMLVVSALGAVLGLAKLIYFHQGGVILQLVDPERGYPLGTSLTMDYNFYSLPLLLGLLSAFWLMKTDFSTIWRSAALLCLPALALAVLLSGSRRGLIVVVCVVPILIAWLFFHRPETPPRRIGSGLVWKAVLAGLALLIILCALKQDSVSEAFNDMMSADSISDVLKRWDTFQEGTYSDSRVHYWTVTLQRLGRFSFLDCLFGEGFSYVTDLGADPDLVEDYPHNFLLSSMLYGGLLQTGILVALVWLVLTRLGIHRPGRSMLGGWFLLIVFFLSTSCNSFFSSEIAVFLTVIGLGLEPTLASQPVRLGPAALRPYSD